RNLKPRDVLIAMVNAYMQTCSHRTTIIIRLMKPRCDNEIRIGEADVVHRERLGALTIRWHRVKVCNSALNHSAVTMLQRRSERKIGRQRRCCPPKKPKQAKRHKCARHPTKARRAERVAKPAKRSRCDTKHNAAEDANPTGVSVTSHIVDDVVMHRRKLHLTR